MKSRFVYVAALGLALVAALLVVLTNGAPATAAPDRLQPVVTTNLKHDTSAPLKELAQRSQPQAPLSPDAINRVLPNKMLDPKFRQDLKEQGIDLPEYIQSQQIVDPIVQEQIGVPYAPSAMPPTLKNFEGVDNVNGVLPPDTVGDIGYDPATAKKYYMQWVNLAYAIWDVTNTPTVVVSSTNGNVLWTGFGGACETSNDGDPIVLFDQLANRWLASQFALPNYPSGPYYQCIAISQTADPTGAWHRYAFVASNTKMNDYPHFGVWPDAYYMTVNQFTGGSSWGGAGVFAFDRARMLSGLSASMIYFDLYGVSADFGGMLPSDWDGLTQPPAGAPNYFFEVDDSTASPGLGPNDAMRVWKFHVDWTTPANSTFGVNGTPNYTLTIAPFNLMPCTLSGSRSCIPQPGTAQGLDVIGDRIMHRVAYRNTGTDEVAVLNHSVDAGSGRAGLRWYEVRGLGGTPSVYQQGTYAPADTEGRWMGSIAMDHVGNIAMGFSVSSGTVYPSIRYTGRYASDPLGVMAQGEATLIAGTGSQTHSAARWGDYSSLTLDPVDDCTFWYTNEYIAVTSSADWQTRIGSFKFDNCSIGPQGAIAGQVTSATDSQPIAGAKVSASSSPTQTSTAYSNPSGNYALIVPVASYTVTGEAYGYLPASFSSVNVVSGTTTTRNIALPVAPTYVISGYVKDSATNDPLMATVAVIGTPFNPPFASVNTDPATGFYSMTLAGGQSYTLTASALLHTAAAQGVTPSGNATVNFNLVATTQNGGLIGYVRNFYTNAPVPNATVTVAAAGNPSDQTDANGYFEIFNLVPGTYTATATANLYSPVSISNITVLSSNIAMRTFLLPTSQLNYNPAALNKTLTLGQVTTDTAGLVISNTGAGALTYALQEQKGGFAPLRPTVGNILVVDRTSASAARAITTALTNLGYTYDYVSNTTFEGYSLATLQQYQAVMYAGNTGTSDTSASNLKLQEYLNAGGKLLIADNDLGYFNTGFAFYDTYLQSVYTADDALSNLTGTVVGEGIMAGVSGDISADPYPDYYTARSAENTPIFKYSTAGSGNAAPAGSIIVRNGYKAVYLAFDYYYLGGSTIGDQIETDVMQRVMGWLGGGSTFDAVPWFSQSPVTGTLATGNSQDIQIVWDASVADIVQPGTYTATLKIDNNDPVAQNTALPVALTVLPAASQGFLTGVVSTTGVCDVNPAPIQGAAVAIQGSAGFAITVTTDATGVYGYWLDAAQSPYTATVSYADHPTTSYSVNVSGGVTTTQNATLRLQKPCVTSSPASLTASAQLGNAAPNQTVYVTSSGALPLDFNVFEVPASLPIGGGPDAYGYTWLTSTFSYIPANDGTALTLGDDDEVNITLPFAFSFYGTSSTSLRVGNNGAVLFNAAAGDISTANAAMSGAPDNFIAPFWDDIDSDTGSVYWKTVGSSPNRQVVIEWYNRPHYSNIGSATFELVLFENGNILYQYLDTDFGNALYNGGVSATAGIRGAGAANSLQYSYNEAKLVDGRAICFVKPGNAPCDAVDVPWLSVSPTSSVALTGTPPTSQLLTVGFDATSLVQPGTYTANLLVSHNAPQPVVNIPVTFTVTAPASYGTLNGTVSGLAACDVNPMPMANAVVYIESGSGMTWTLHTNGSGFYQVAMDAVHSPITVTASNEAGYEAQTVAGAVVTATGTTTLDFDLRRYLPCQDLPTTAITATLQTNKVTTQTLTVHNMGAAALVWNIEELAPALLAAPSTETYNRVPRYIPPANIPLAAPLVNAIQDGSFEATNGGTFANPYWGQNSVTYGTVLCDVATCTPAGQTQAPRTGTYWAWFGGASAGDVGYVQQTVVLTPGVSSLSFYLMMEANSNAGNFLKVSIDGTPVFTATTADQANYATYTLVTVDVTAFGDGASHVVRFDSTTLGGGNFHVDDVALDITGPACEPNSLPWVTAVPVSGTIAAGGSANVSLVFDSTGLAGGTYAGTLCYASNDPIAPSVQIPVTLKVISEYKVFLPLVRR